MVGPRGPWWQVPFVAGDEAALREQLTAFGAAGATDFLAWEFGSGEERARTRALLAGWVAAAV